MQITQTVVDKFQPAITSAYLALTNSSITLAQFIQEAFDQCDTELELLEYLKSAHGVPQNVLDTISVRRYVADVPELLAEYMEEKSGFKATELSLGSGREVWWKCTAKGHVFERSVVERVNHPKCPECLCEASFEFLLKNSLAKKCPELAKELLEEKSGFKATEVLCGSKKLAGWKCTAKGHIFEKVVWERVKNSKCSECLLLKNSLAKKCPELAKELLEERSGFKASEISYGSKKLAGWKCTAKGHIFERSVNRRVNRPKCPECIRESLFKNSLAKKCPELAKELLEEKSGFKASEISCGSGKGAWWKCSAKGHVFDKTVVERVKHPKCPKCAREALLKNSLAKKCPELAKELMEERSGFKASEIAWKSNKKAWWKCSTEGHIFQKVVQKRVLHLQCPICRKEK